VAPCASFRSLDRLIGTSLFIVILVLGTLVFCRQAFLNCVLGSERDFNP
jgi:hypothetical protein